jgi:hypothetical protein
VTAECAVNAGQHESESSCNSSKHVMVSNPVMSSQYGEEVILEAQTQTRLKLARGYWLGSGRSAQSWTSSRWYSVRQTEHG